MKSPEHGQTIGQNSEKPGKKTSLPAPSLWWRRPVGVAARAVGALLIAGAAAFLTDTATQTSSAVSPRSSHQIQTVTDSPPNPIYFDSSLGPRKWYFDNARWGIPPNDPDMRVGTIDDYAGYYIINYIQPFQVDYEWNEVVIDGVIVDPVAKKAFMLTAIWQQGNRYVPRVEGIQDVNTPKDHAGRKVYQDVLPQDGAYGDGVSSVGWHTDDQGLSVDIGLKNSVIPGNDGLWRCALNSYYEIIGKCVKVVTQPSRVFLSLIQRPS